MNPGHGSGRMEMPEYDARAWAALADLDHRSARRLLPSMVRERLSKASAAARSQLESLPGFERFERLLVDALGGLTEFGSPRCPRQPAVGPHAASARCGTEGPVNG